MNRTPRNASILIVEDNLDHQVLLRYVLQRSLANITPIFTETAEQGLNYLNECLANEVTPPRLVLLDLYLPKAESGWTFLEELQTLPAPHRPPVVVLSVSREEDDINKAYELGASSFISKPIGQAQWLAYFDTIRQYWWETVTLPGN